MIDPNSPTEDTSVQGAPPNLSVSGAKAIRAPAPTNGPRNAYFATSGIV